MSEQQKDLFGDETKELPAVKRLKELREFNDMIDAAKVSHVEKFPPTTYQPDTTMSDLIKSASNIVEQLLKAQLSDGGVALSDDMTQLYLAANQFLTATFHLYAPKPPTARVKNDWGQAWGRIDPEKFVPAAEELAKLKGMPESCYPASWRKMIDGLEVGVMTIRKEEWEKGLQDLYKQPTMAELAEVLTSPGERPVDIPLEIPLPHELR